ncbi:MAG: PD-(D/E)XK nuclease family protein [Desulfovibrio sp.]|jgi:hypothetical protein|nr:PD-(D/E)XK nuclease family protein [Desulfovibrio sp.]
MPPFLVFSRQRPFLPDLKALVDLLTSGRPDTALVIVPNNRPKRYLRHLYTLEKSLSFPEVITIGEAAEIWRDAAEQTPARAASTLDQVYLLHERLKDPTFNDESVTARFADMDMALFLPWGMRLSSLLEELLRQDVEARDIIHAGVEAGPMAATLLGALGRIARAWRAALAAGGWTTPGLNYAAAACAARGESPIPKPLAPALDKPVLAAGFYMLTGTEDALLHRLWRAGAHICLHSDTGLVAGRGGEANCRTEKDIHWSCAGHWDWIEQWKAKTVFPFPEETANPRAVAEKARPSCFFFAGYDCHSQLEALREKLRDPRYAESTAVVLPDKSLLMPVLHHLPNKDVNISMGYPLGRSSLCRLVENLFQLFASCNEDGRFYWRDLRQTLRHPYLNMLSAQGETGESVFLRKALRLMESLVLEGERFVDMPALRGQCRAALPALDCALLEETTTLLLNPLEHAETTAQIADWLSGLCDFLLRHGGDMWRRFPLDAEAIYRLAAKVVPQLKNALSALVPFPRGTLRNIVRHVLHEERVPFEADPITGLQVIGMLETRLLHFDHVFILDATEDKLPGNPPPDPLLPDSLRAVLGLPDARERGRAMAHTFYRLCAGAKEAHFFWQEGSSPELFDGKKYRSRFVEQLLWEEEQRLGKLLTPGTPPLMAAIPTLSGAHMPSGDPQSLPKGQRLTAALEIFLRAPLSASRLDDYLQCPLNFAQSRLCALQPQKTVHEGNDPPAVGECLHKALHDLYSTRLNRTLYRDEISPREALDCFYKAAADLELERRLPTDAWLVLEAAAPFRLEQFLLRQPEKTHIVALEKKLALALPLCGREYEFTGVFDRLDKRDGLLHVLDYKTGSPKIPNRSLWTDNAFFADVESQLSLAAKYPEQTPEALEFLIDKMREHVPSLQLPCYLTMLDAAKLGAPGEASIVALGNDGREEPLFGGLHGADLGTAIGYCRLVLALTLANLERTTAFRARHGRHCDWCPYAGLCAV